MVLQPVVQERPFHAVNVAQLCRHFRADACFHQDSFAPGVHQQAIHRQLNAIAPVAGNFLFPHCFGYYAEHRAAIEPDISIHQHVKFQVP